MIKAVIFIRRKLVTVGFWAKSLSITVSQAGTYARLHTVELLSYFYMIQCVSVFSFSKLLNP